MRLLVTGAAGFIGAHVAHVLLARGDEVIGLDDMNAYYDPALKQARLDRLQANPAFSFIMADVADQDRIARLFSELRPQRVVHLAAQAGVRYSIENPHVYGRSNLTGFLNILEGCRSADVEHLVYASSSSVYGANAKLPFSETDAVDHPVSFYAATKKANEVMAHAYAHLYRLPTTGLRFFTVYGPWGRPDMALFKFTDAILAGQPIEVYNNGHHARDLTYIDDVAEGVVRTLDRPAKPDNSWAAMAPDPSTSNAPFRIYNIGNHEPVVLMDLVRLLERTLGVTANIKFVGMQPGDVAETLADISRLASATGFSPATPVAEGVSRFVAWYREFYKR